MKDGFARHTPVLSGTRVIRALSVDGALLASIGGALGDLAVPYQWRQVGDTVDDIVAELSNAVLSWYTPMNIGQIGFFVGSLPLGWLAMDGSTYSGDTYPELMEIIDSQFKDVGQNEFTLPDLGGIFPLGDGNGYVLGDTGGSVSITLTVDELPEHNHSYTPPVANVDLEAPGAPDILAAGVGTSTSTGNSGGGQAHDNMPPYFVLVVGCFSGRET